MTESKDEETGPEDMGRERKALKGKERDSFGDWNVAFLGEFSQWRHPFQNTFTLFQCDKFVRLSYSSPRDYTYLPFTHPTTPWLYHTYTILLPSCGREQ